MIITQKEKILDLFYVVQQAHTLFFIVSTKLNPWEIKKDRELLNKKHVFTYKTNVYRAVEVFNAIPFFKRFSNSIQGPFFIGHTDQQKSYKQLLEIFDLKTTHLKVIFTVQNNVFFSKQRLFAAERLCATKTLAWPLKISSTFSVVQKFHLFLISVLHCCALNKKI